MFDYGYIPVIPMFIGIVIILIFIIIFLRFFPIGLWVTALFSGVRINMITLITMRLRRVNPSLIVLNQIKLWKAGLKIGSNELEAHYLAGGNPTAVADALIAAVAHDEFSGLNVEELLKEKHVVYDVKCMLNREIVDGRL